MFQCRNDVQNALRSKSFRERPLSIKVLLPQKPARFAGQTCNGGNSSEFSFWHFKKGQDVVLGISNEFRILPDASAIRFTSTHAKKQQTVAGAKVQDGGTFIIDLKLLMAFAAIQSIIGFIK
ncbi:hypothetical protein [Deinococcus cellulosilyticus]|uniref:hypothetical protein n=1 Tax=Deinococcus cellulosilyticus TaxID=401558 RepID=UPI0011BE0726|nr:hypothetical protein [Deinococcus cellulosilyticus]